MQAENTVPKIVPDASLPKGMRWMLYAWWVLLTLTIWPYTFDPVAPIKYFLTACFGVILLCWLTWRAWQGRARFPGGTVWLLLYLIAQLPGLFQAENTLYALVHYQRDIVFVGIALVVAQLAASEKHRNTLLRVMVVTVGLASIYGLCQKCGLDPFPWSDRTHAEYLCLPATFGHPNFAAHVLTPMLFLCAYLIRSAWREKQRAWLGILIAVFLLMATHLYFTQSRGALLALIAAGGFLGLFGLLLKGIKRFRLAMALTLLLSLAGVTTAIIGGAHYLARLERPADVPLDSSLLVRVNANVGAMRMMRDRPLQGFGPGGYARHVPVYWTHFEQQWYALYGKSNRHVHCELLEAGVDGGLPTLAALMALYLWAVITSLQWAMRQTKPERRWLGYALAGAMVVMIVEGMFGFNLHAPVSRGLFFVLIGLVGGLRMSNDEMKRNTCILSGKRRKCVATGYTLLFCLVIFGTLMESRVFIGEVLHQRAQGVKYWRQHFQQAGQPEEAQAILETGIKLSSVAAFIAHWDARHWLLAAEFQHSRNLIHDAGKKYVLAHIAAPYEPRYAIQVARYSLLQARMSTGGRMEMFLYDSESYARDAICICAMYGPAQEVLGHAVALRAQLETNAGEDATATWQRAAEHLRLALRYGLDQPGNTLALLRDVEAQLDAED